MSKLLNILGVSVSALCVAAMIAVGIQGLPTEVEALPQPETTVAHTNPLGTIRPRARPSLWERTSKEDRECLAMNVYHEARGESVIGQLAVAEVTLNRVNLDQYPDSICEVVWQRKQFSWTHDSRSDTPRDQTAWTRAQVVAHMAGEAYEQGVDLTDGADHYHADWVSPSWADRDQVTRQIGAHIFYDLL